MCLGNGAVTDWGMKEEWRPEESSSRQITEGLGCPAKELGLHFTHQFWTKHILSEKGINVLWSLTSAIPVGVGCRKAWDVCRRLFSTGLDLRISWRFLRCQIPGAHLLCASWRCRSGVRPCRWLCSLVRDQSLRAFEHLGEQSGLMSIWGLSYMDDF
jgi:hypothetical protein